jgi:uncharacterized membrane protein
MKDSTSVELIGVFGFLILLSLTYFDFINDKIAIYFSIFWLTLFVYLFILIKRMEGQLEARCK